ncbi:MAG: DUF1640 domain-containing protein [Nitrospirae bacterium]|nr:MAG: DUF1640 domain-containing protein [Nitrospirota bacterium]
MTTLTRLFPLLKQLGLDDQKAQEFIETLEGGLIEHVASKTDLEKVHADLAVKIEAIKADLATKIEASKTDVEKIHADLAVKIEALKADQEKVKADLTTKIETTKADLAVKIEASKADLLRWLFGAWATLFLAILALFLKLP